MDENVIQVALYTMREVNGGTEVKLLDQQISDKVPDQIVMADSLDYAGIFGGRAKYLLMEFKHFCLTIMQEICARLNLVCK
jgi:hypothetical protein